MDARTRAALQSALKSLCTWQQRLRGWPALTATLPDATPFVSLYAGGRLRGCMGSDEGSRGGERVARAFLLALHDARGATPRGAERASLAARVSYIVSPRRIAVADAPNAIEPGTHGIAWAPNEGAASVLLPFVARDGGLDARGLLAALTRKARLADDTLRDDRGTLFLFASDDVVFTPAGAIRDPAGTAAERGARWLARLVDARGAMAYAIDPVTGARIERGGAYHARVAVAIEALGRIGGHPSALARARGALAREIERALRGRDAVASWPAHPAQIAGSLALAMRAGVFEGAVVREFATAQHDAIASSAWHAAQVVGVLGNEAPRALWDACVADLARRPWAPWTAMAAQRMNDAATLERSARALIESLRREGPHRGGATVTAVPEIALTAVAVEALAPLRSREARAACTRGRAFLERWQLDAARLTPALNPDAVLGAFPASPVRDVLRCDLTGHAVLALASAR